MKISRSFEFPFFIALWVVILDYQSPPRIEMYRRRTAMSITIKSNLKSALQPFLDDAGDVFFCSEARKVQPGSNQPGGQRQASEPIICWSVGFSSRGPPQVSSIVMVLVRLRSRMLAAIRPSPE